MHACRSEGGSGRSPAALNPLLLVTGFPLALRTGALHSCSGGSVLLPRSRFGRWSINWLGAHDVVSCPVSLSLKRIARDIDRKFGLQLLDRDLVSGEAL
jgi:hypothetical protein